MSSSKEDEFINFLRLDADRTKDEAPSLARPVARVATTQFSSPRRLSPVVRPVKRRLLRSRRRLLLVVAVIVIVGVVGFVLVGVPLLLYYSTIANGSVSSPHLVFSGSFIHVNTAAGSGEVFVKIYNEGPGSVRIRSIMISREGGAVAITFPDEHCGSLNCAVSGNPGTGVLDGNLLIPAGATVSVDYRYESIALFQPAAVYQATLSVADEGDVPFTIPSENVP